jgi:hypothetical protein
MDENKAFMIFGIVVAICFSLLIVNLGIKANEHQEQMVGCRTELK